jgi:hypothetical protein
MYQQLWGYKVEEKLYLGVREEKSLNTTGLDDGRSDPVWNCSRQLIVLLDVVSSLKCQVPSLKCQGSPNLRTKWPLLISFPSITLSHHLLLNYIFNPPCS